METSQKNNYKNEHIASKTHSPLPVSLPSLSLPLLSTQDLFSGKTPF